MQDTNANGKVDRLTMTFSEALAPYSAPSSVWSLANVPSGGTLGTVTVTSPTVTLAITEGPGATDTAVGAFTVTLASNAAGVRDAAGNLSSFTKTPADGARPIRQSQEMFDDNRNGKIDRVLVVFSEALAPFSAPTSFSLSSAPSGATLGAVGVSGAQATLTLIEGTGAATTAVGSFRVTLTSNPAGIRDASGNLASYAATAPTDRAAPALVTLSLLDNNGNGKVDRVTALFSETLQAYTAGTAPWTLTNVPSGGTVASAARASATITLTLTEGAGAANTSVGAMTVAMAANAAGARDALGNLGSFTATTPLDRAKPAAVTITDTNGSTDGRVQPGDTVVITFSEPLAPASVPSFHNGHPDRPDGRRQRHPHDGRCEQRRPQPGLQQLHHPRHRGRVIRELAGCAEQLRSDHHGDGRLHLCRNRLRRTRPADDQRQLLVRRCADADGHGRQHCCDGRADAEHPDVLSSSQPPARLRGSAGNARASTSRVEMSAAAHDHVLEVGPACLDERLLAGVGRGLDRSPGRTARVGEFVAFHPATRLQAAHRAGQRVRPESPRSRCTRPTRSRATVR